MLLFGSLYPFGVQHNVVQNATVPDPQLSSCAPKFRELRYGEVVRRIRLLGTSVNSVGCQKVYRRRSTCQRWRRSLQLATVDDVDVVVEQYQLALGEFLKGDPEPLKMMYSHPEDLTFANPFGPPAISG